MPKKHKTSPLYPEPGSSVLQSYEGLPKQSPPQPLSDEPLTANEVKDHISYDGLGFCIYSFIPPEKIVDKRLKELWSNANEAMRSIVEYLETVRPPRESKLKRAKKKKRRFKPKRRLRLYQVDDTEEL